MYLTLTAVSSIANSNLNSDIYIKLFKELSFTCQMAAVNVKINHSPILLLNRCRKCFRITVFVKALFLHVDTHFEQCWQFSISISI